MIAIMSCSDRLAKLASADLGLRTPAQGLIAQPLVSSDRNNATATGCEADTVGPSGYNHGIY